MVHTRKLAHVGLGVAMLLALTAGSAAATGVRATAMGGAYTALSNDVSALFYNPAGIGQKSLDVTLGVSSPNPESLQNAVQVLNSNPSGADLEKLGNGMALSAMGGASIGPLALGVNVDGNYTLDSNAHTAQAVIMTEAAGGLGLRIAHAPLTGAEVRLGFAGHVLQGQSVEYTNTDTNPTAGTPQTGQGFYLNAGAIARITPLVSLGVSATNLGYKYQWVNGPVVEQKPVYTGGVALKVPILGITLAADGDTNRTIRYGAETNIILNLISLRVGQIKPADGPTVTTGGVSVNFGPISAGVAAESSDLANSKLDRVVAEGSIRF